MTRGRHGRVRGVVAWSGVGGPRVAGARRNGSERRGRRSRLRTSSGSFTPGSASRRSSSRCRPAAWRSPWTRRRSLAACGRRDGDAGRRRPPCGAPRSRRPLPARGPRRGRRPAGTASEPTFAADTRTVRVPVAVLDRSGRPVLDLDRGAFRVADDGKRQAVTLFSRERRPLRIALALDRQPQHGQQDPPGRGGPPALHRSPRARGRDPRPHVQRPRPRRPGLHVGPRSPRARARRPRAERRYRALRRRVRRHPEGRGRAGREQGGRPRDRRRRHGELGLAQGPARDARRAEVPVFSIGLDAENPHLDLAHGPDPRRPRRPARGRRRPGGGGGGWGGGGGGWGGGRGGGGWGRGSGRPRPASSTAGRSPSWRTTPAPPPRS